MTGVLTISRHPDGDQTTVINEDLDFEQTWWEGTKLVFKSYDRFGAVHFVKIEASILMEDLLGFAAQVEIKGPITERKKNGH